MKNKTAMKIQLQSLPILKKKRWQNIKQAKILMEQTISGSD